MLTDAEKHLSWFLSNGYPWVIEDFLYTRMCQEFGIVVVAKPFLVGGFSSENGADLACTNRGRPACSTQICHI